MQRSIRLACVATIAAALAAPVWAAPRGDAPVVPTDVSAQRQTKKKQRAQITVRPRLPYARTHSLYPRPYDRHYPGPNAKRHCVGGLVLEHRPSGTVLVPRRRCWWAPG